MPGEVAAPAPDKDVEAQLQKQQREADQAEKDAAQAAPAGQGGGRKGSLNLTAICRRNHMQREFVVGIQLWTLVISGILSWSLAARRPPRRLRWRSNSKHS